MKIVTPRGTVYHKTGKNGAVNTVLKWDPDFDDKWADHYDKAQVFIDNEVLRLSDPYIPMQTGMLKRLGILGTIPGRGEVIWKGPYARYLYYGKLMVGRAPKRLTNTDLTFHGAPKRGALWFERMKKDKLGVIRAGVGKIIGGGTK